jgi:hypothetical protein
MVFFWLKARKLAVKFLQALAQIMLANTIYTIYSSMNYNIYGLFPQ